MSPERRPSLLPAIKGVSKRGQARATKVTVPGRRHTAAVQRGDIAILVRGVSGDRIVVRPARTARLLEVAPSTQHVTIEAELIDELLSQLQTGTVSAGDVGQGGLDPSEEFIETFFLCADEVVE